MKVKGYAIVRDDWNGTGADLPVPFHVYATMRGALQEVKDGERIEPVVVTLKDDADGQSADWGQA